MAVNTDPSKLAPVLENIFQYLPARDLSNCACVCVLWKNAATEEEGRRRKIEWIFHGSTCQNHPLSQMWRCYDTCPMVDNSEFESKLRQQFMNLRTKPAICIAFATSRILEDFEELFPIYASNNPLPENPNETAEYRHKCLEKVIEAAFKNNLPTGCQVGCYVGNSVVGTRRDLSTHQSKESPAIAAFLFPDLPDEELKLYRRNLHNFDLPRDVINNRDIKCVLALVEFVPMTYFAIALGQRNRILHIQASGCAMAIQRENGYIPVFSGPGVEVVALGNPHLYERVLGQMEERGFFNNQTIGFIFSDRFGPPHHHSEIFKELGNGIPVIGLFGDHEVEYDSRKEKSPQSECEETLVEYNLHFRAKYILVSFRNL